MNNIVNPIAEILIIENDEDLLELETQRLTQEGYRVIGLTSTQTVEKLLKEENIDLMLVARMLPRIEGSEFVSYLRDKGVITPVMFISTKDKDHEIEEGYQCGGDDYLRKPFNMNELLYRVKALLRRTSAIEYERVTARDIVMDFNTRKTYIDNKQINLTKLEFELLAIFLKNKNRALGRDYLLKKIWNGEEQTQKRTVNVTINRLKKKIDPLETKEYIIPVRGIGYKFN